jgi:hypothetical protein
MSGKERCKFKAGPKGCANVIHWMPDGRTLLVAGQDGVIRIVQAPDGKKLGQLKGHDTSIVSLALAGDGKTLVSGSADTTALVYDASSLPRADRPRTTIDAARFDAIWKDLALEDAGKAFQAGQTLASADNATQFLETKAKPVTLDPKRVPQLITDLGVNDFQVRERAMKELEKLGELAEVDLNQALQNKPSLELQQRAKQILARLAMHESPPVEVLQMHRALEVLECLGTSDARRILQTVATGAPGASLTRAARAALDRLAKDKP